ncbi:hypothetical protein quinque_013688 [Culex quinquefasciatus]
MIFRVRAILNTMSDESMELGPATQAEIFDVEQFLEDCDEEFALHGNHQQREEREQNAGEEREQNVGKEGEALQDQASDGNHRE